MYSFFDLRDSINKCLGHAAIDTCTTVVIPLNCMALNVEQGSLHSQAWWQEERDAAAQYLAMLDPTDPLLTWLGPKIRHAMCGKYRLMTMCCKSCKRGTCVLPSCQELRQPYGATYTGG